jgi:hypothetical protein
LATGQRGKVEFFGEISNLYQLWAIFSKTKTPLYELQTTNTNPTFFFGHQVAKFCHQKNDDFIIAKKIAISSYG